MVDIVDFALGKKYPSIFFGKLKYKEEPSTTSLIKAEYELKIRMGQDVPPHFDFMLEYMEKYCGNSEAIRELKDRVEEMAQLHWSNLLSEIGSQPDDIFRFTL